jgi:hypothetical protein
MPLFAVGRVGRGREGIFASFLIGVALLHSSVADALSQRNPFRVPDVVAAKMAARDRLRPQNPDKSLSHRRFPPTLQATLE